MGSSGKKKTTMAKLARENRLRERRLIKQAKKDARKHASASEQSGYADVDAEAPDVDAQAPQGAEPRADDVAVPQDVAVLTVRDLAGEQPAALEAAPSQDAPEGGEAEYAPRDAQRDHAEHRA